MNVENMTPEQKNAVLKKMVQTLLKAIKQTPGGSAALGRVVAEDPQVFQMLMEFADAHEKAVAETLFFSLPPR